MDPIKIQKTESKPSLPGIIIDIDGVLIKGKLGIPRSLEALEILRKPIEINQKKYNIPFTLLTNGGGNLEKNHATVINNKMQIKDQNTQIKEEEMILNFTPLRNIIKSYQQKNQLILIAGSLNYIDIMHDMNITNYITVSEYVRCFPEIMGLGNYTQEEIDSNRRKVLARLNIKDDQIFQNNQYLQIHSIFLLYEPKNQEEVIQLICDLCITEDGTIPKELPKTKPTKHIPVYVVNNDTVYKDSFQLPRLAFGSFNMSLEKIAKRTYGIDLKITYYGKPAKITFEYAQNRLQERFGDDIQFSNYYMIGDNPQSDIKGANNAGIKSILVQTGVHQSQENDKQSPATFLVKDFYEALQLIYKEENLPFNQ